MPTLAHHLQTLVIVTSPIVRILVLCLALAVGLAIPMSTINPHKRLSLRLQHRLCRVVIPAVYKVAMEAITNTNLSTKFSV